MYLVEIVYYRDNKNCQLKSESVIFADNYEKAIHELSTYYDEEDIISISIKRVGQKK